MSTLCRILVTSRILIFVYIMEYSVETIGIKRFYDHLISIVLA